METTFNRPDILPDVFLRVLNVLEEGKSPISWTLTKSWNGQLSLNIVHSPSPMKHLATGQRLCGQGQDQASPVSSSVKRKRKSPSRRKRDRERWNRWRRKRKLCARADPKPVTDPKAIDQVVTSNVDTNPSALDIQPVICAKVQDSSPQCQEYRRSEHPVHTCEEEGSTSAPSGSNLDSDDDVSDDACDFEMPDICATCNMGPPEVNLRKCSKCKLSKYCSLQCQRENWKEHKFACSIVAGQRMCK